MELAEKIDDFSFKRCQQSVSWSDFVRVESGSSAAKLSESLRAGTYIEINDRKFQGAPVVVVRKSDLERLQANSRISFRVKSVFAILKQAVTTLIKSSKGSVDQNELRIIYNSIELGVNLTLDFQPMYSSMNSYLSQELSDIEDDDVDFDLPESRSALKEGVRARSRD